ncbi:hypothetical protein PInf_019953 [Phytophthora infestans]|nr:hypothetical protein PInf_019953 [Phytophthora infestans]
MTLGRVAPLLALGVLSPVNAALYTPASGLRQVIVLSRHGVRGPYGLGTESPSEDLLKKYVLNPNLDLPLSAKAWGTSESEDPAEIVSPKLTKHGFHVVKQMGAYFRDHLYEEFLHAACEETFAYADDNQRDNLTAVAFLSGLYPLCTELVPITKELSHCSSRGKILPLAVLYARELCMKCCAESVCNIDEEPGTSNLTEDSTTCDLFGIPTQWNGAFYLPWKDTLSNVNYFSEWLLLQSLNNMSLPSQLSFEKILSLARIHETHMDLITNEVNSANFGATLLAHLTASFEQNVMQKPLPVAKGEGPHLLQGPDNRLLYYAAHDINLLYVRNLLRLQWHTKGWHPHQPVPGGMLVFELHATPLQNSEEQPLRTSQSRSLKDSGRVSWEADEAVGTDDASRFYVKLYFVAASPEQIRNGDELSPENPPNRVQVIIPSCSEEVNVGDGVTDVRCPFLTFKKLIGKTLKHVCVADTLRPFVDSLTQKKMTNNFTFTSTVTMDQTGDVEVSDVDISSPSPKTAAALEASLWTMFGALILCFIVLLIHHAVKRRQEYGSIPM